MATNDQWLDDCDDFEEFWNRNRGRIVRFVIFLGASVHDADDIAQTVGEESWSQWVRIRDRPVWMRTVARREFLRFVTARGREDVSRMPAGAEDKLPAGACLDESTVAINRLLDRLTTQEREAMACKMDGLSYAETAQILGTTAGSARASTARARRKLKQFLDSESREDNDDER